MKMTHLSSIFVHILSVALCLSADDVSGNRPNDANPDVVGTWKSERTTLSIHPDGRFESNGGPKIEYGIWEESGDGGFYLRYGARNRGEAGLSRAGHFVIEQGDIVFHHDDEVERLKKVERPKVTEQNDVKSSTPVESVGTIKIMDDFSKRVASCLKDFQSLKPGISRSEISRIFPLDGGIQGISPVRFAHPDCPYFKFEVEFEFKTDSDDQNRAIRGDDDRATIISKPYIEAPHLD